MPVEDGDTTTLPPVGVDAVVTFTVDVASARDCPPSVHHTLNTNSYDRPGDRLYGATYTCSTCDDIIDDADNTLDARFVPFTLLAASLLMLNTDQADDNDDDSGRSAV